MIERIKAMIAERAKLCVDQIHDDSRFIGDLGIDSFELLVLIADIEDLLGVEISEQVVWQLQTFGDVRAYLERL